MFRHIFDLLKMYHINNFFGVDFNIGLCGKINKLLTQNL